ncbi:MAG: hypothetical protein HQ530_02250 [Parcubacteria group bacterium]|nr:hypothetical protein [Parcubacteria group bacterium]
MSKQKIISIIQSSQLPDNSKKKLLAEIKDKEETPDILDHVTKTLKETKKAKFKTMEINRLAGERMRQLRRQHLRHLQKVALLLDHSVKKATNIAEGKGK